MSKATRDVSAAASAAASANFFPPLKAKLTRRICLPHSHGIGTSDFPRTRRAGSDPPRQRCAHPGGASPSYGAGVKGEAKGCGAHLGKHYRALYGR